MMKTIAVIKTEIKQDLTWHLGWIIGINAYTLMAIFIYPGKEGMKKILGLFQEEYFQAILGDIGGESPSFALWISLMMPMMAVAYFLQGILTGSRTVSKIIDDNNGEIVLTYPINRLVHLAYRWIASVLMFGLDLLILAILLRIPFIGESIGMNRLLPTIGWGLLYMTVAMSIGIFFAMITGDTGKGQQLGLLFTLFLYASQILANFQNTDWILEINLLSWYTPGGTILGNEIETEMLWKLSITLLAFILINFYHFRDINLIPGSKIHIPLLARLSLPKIFRRSDKSKSIKRSIYTSWARPLEKKFPFTANFIYSERRVIMIVIIGILLVWPGQLLVYPASKDSLDIEAFGAFGGIMKLFTYGHDIQDIYLWFVVTQAIGNHWFFFVPLLFYWIGKIMLREGETKTGEIMGSIPVEPHMVLLQRLFAIFLEIILFTLLMIISLILSEVAINENYNMVWEIIAILSYIPLYLFLMTALFSIALVLKENGVKVARVLLMTMMFFFAAGILNDNLSWIVPWTVFGLFDPVAIILETSLSVNYYGVFILLSMSVITTVSIFLLSTRYTWLNIVEDDSMTS